MLVQEPSFNVNLKPKKFFYSSNFKSALIRVFLVRKVGLDGTVKIKEQLLPNTPTQEKKRKQIQGFFPSAAFGQFHAFQRLFFPFSFSLFRAISAQLYKEPFQKSFTLPHYVFQFHHTEAETERL